MYETRQNELRWAVNKIITVEILGERFSFKTDETDVDPQRVVDYVVSVIDEIAHRLPENIRSTNKTAILVQAALDIARQFLICRQDQTRLMEIINRRTKRLAVLLKNLS